MKSQFPCEIRKSICVDLKKFGKTVGTFVVILKNVYSSSMKECPMHNRSQHFYIISNKFHVELNICQNNGNFPKINNKNQFEKGLFCPSALGEVVFVRASVSVFPRADCQKNTLTVKSNYFRHLRQCTVTLLHYERLCTFIMS